MPVAAPGILFGAQEAELSCLCMGTHPCEPRFRLLGHKLLEGTKCRVLPIRIAQFWQPAIANTRLLKQTR